MLYEDLSAGSSHAAVENGNPGALEALDRLVGMVFATDQSGAPASVVVRVGSKAPGRPLLGDRKPGRADIALALFERRKHLIQRREVLDYSLPANRLGKLCDEINVDPGDLNLLFAGTVVGYGLIGEGVLRYRYRQQRQNLFRYWRGVFLRDRRAC